MGNYIPISTISHRKVRKFEIQKWHFPKKNCVLLFQFHKFCLVTTRDSSRKNITIIQACRCIYQNSWLDNSYDIVLFLVVRNTRILVPVSQLPILTQSFSTGLSPFLAFMVSRSNLLYFWPTHSVDACADHDSLLPASCCRYHSERVVKKWFSLANALSTQPIFQSSTAIDQ